MVYPKQKYNLKTTIKISIDKALLSEIKKYAILQDTSISALVTEYFYSIIKPKNIIELVEALNPPLINVPNNLKESYYNRLD